MKMIVETTGSFGLLDPYTRDYIKPFRPSVAHSFLTTSTLRPLLFTNRLLHNVAPSLMAADKIEDMVMHGVDRLISMQTPSGGFAYWPGGTEPTYWGTAYATHILMEAQKLRYPVSQVPIDDAVTWMGDQITNYYERGRTDRSWYTSNAEP